MNTSHNKVSADVIGTYNYYVSIELDHNVIDKMSCECPYALDENKPIEDYLKEIELIAEGSINFMDDRNTFYFMEMIVDYMEKVIKPLYVRVL